MDRGVSKNSGLPALTCGLLVALAISGISYGGCAVSTTQPPKPAAARARVLTPAELQSASLMAKYGLQPVGGPSGSREMTLTPDGQELIGVDWIRLSKRIGLDPGAYVGQRVSEVSYTLQERDQAEDGTITAVFLVTHERVVAAELALSGYRGGRGTALNDHEQFAAPGLSADHLTFAGVKSVLVYAEDQTPGGSVTLGTPAKFRKLLTLVAASKPRAGDSSGVVGDEEYDFELTYANGAIIRCHLVTPKRGGATFLVINTLTGVQFDPAPDLKKYVKGLVTSG